MMPSLRQKVTTYFRQLSFIGESRDGARSSTVLSPRKVDDGTFITKYLEGRIDSVFSPGPDICHGKEPNELPDLEIARYPSGPHTITAACTGPEDGLTSVRRSKLHLSAGSDIDFIDTNYDQEPDVRRSSISQQKNKIVNAKYRSDQNANKTSSARQRKNSRSSDSTLAKNDLKNEKQTSVDAVVSMMSKRASSVADSNTCKSEVCHIATRGDLLDTVKVNDNFGMDETLSNVAQIQQKTNEVCLNQNDVEPDLIPPIKAASEPIAGVDNWKLESEHAYGVSVSLYENNFLTKDQMGSPIADCFGMVVRGNSCAMALADGVNWGEGARLASRSAIQGCLDYLNTAIFGTSQNTAATSTRDVFVSLLRSLWEGHACILETGGALSTLTVAVVLPLAEENAGKYAVCSCNVGDSLGYVYSKKHGVREFTQGSHDLSSMRDMRDALGAIGPVDGNKPELSNLTLSMTVVEAGDIVFLTSDGVSDNFDPVVGKFADAFSTEKKLIEPQLAPKRQNKSTSALPPRSNANDDKRDKRYSLLSQPVSHTTGSSGAGNQVVPQRPPRVKKSTNSSHGYKTSIENDSLPTTSSRPKYLRSHTVIEPRTSHKSTVKFPRSAAGLPVVSAFQRHALTLLRLEDLLSYGINGTLRPCPSARKLCHLLIDFVKMITAARRKMLEQRELFFKIVTDPATGIRREVELNRVQHRGARKRIVDSTLFSSLPGKLDHASVVAFTVGSGLQSTEFNETDF